MQEISIDRDATAERRDLDDDSWVDVTRGWLRGADDVYAALVEGVPWRQGRVFRYERYLDEPRLGSWFDRDTPYPHPVLTEAHRALQHQYRVTFGGVGLAFYRDGRDSVAPHNDHLDEIVSGFPIALLSLGTTRRMTIRAKASPKRVLHVDLAAGSLLVMSYETQLHYTHGIPKTAEPVGPRISLAFRVRPAPDPAKPGFYR